ncbi:MAG: hypothetical protein QXP66_00925 [Candidatus Aenigmatarchaeota archaeon]
MTLLKKLILRELLKEAQLDVEPPTLEEYIEGLQAERPYSETFRKLFPFLAGAPALGAVASLLAKRTQPLIAGLGLGGLIGLGGLLRAYLRQREIETQLTHPTRARQGLAALRAELLGRATGRPQFGEAISSLVYPATLMAEGLSRD